MSLLNIDCQSHPNLIRLCPENEQCTVTTVNHNLALAYIHFALQWESQDSALKMNSVL